MLTLDLIVNFFSILANIAIILTMIYGIKAFKQDKKNVKADLDWRMKHETIVFANEIFSKTDSLLSEIKSRFGNQTINVTDLQKEENSELNKIISQYLPLMERLSVGLNTKVYDLDVYARICCSKTIKAWDQLHNVIIEKRNNNHNNLIYIEFEEVVNSLREWKKHTPETRGKYQPLP